MKFSIHLLFAVLAKVSYAFSDATNTTKDDPTITPTSTVDCPLIFFDDESCIGGYKSYTRDSNGCEYPICILSTTTSPLPTNKPLPTFINHKCGKEHGKCPSGECCSKYGWCGKSDKHCQIDEGCQSEFGECKSKTTEEPLPTSVSHRCGKEHGKCSSGQCCSKYGWCGKSDKHCQIDEGCQSEFGECKSKTTKKPLPTTTPPLPTPTDKPLPTSVSHRCGKEYGKCPSGECCSKYGWCGKSDKHCKIKEGCQSEFGDCKGKTTTKITTKTTTKKRVTTTKKSTSDNGKCGNKYGKCPSGQCCSKYGWCGKSESYCGNGCQKEFGKCK